MQTWNRSHRGIFALSSWPSSGSSPHRAIKLQAFKSRSIVQACRIIDQYSTDVQELSIEVDSEGPVVSELKGLTKELEHDLKALQAEKGEVDIQLMALRATRVVKVCCALNF